jgi:hypothetical protein
MEGALLTFTIEMQKEAEDANVGLHVDNFGGEYLKIKNIKAGIFDTFNKGNPTKAVKVDDFISSVNGKRGNSDELLSEIQAANMLTITISRRQVPNTVGDTFEAEDVEEQKQEDASSKWSVPPEEEMPWMPTRSGHSILPGYLIKDGAQLSWNALPDGPEAAMPLSMLAELPGPTQLEVRVQAQPRSTSQHRTPSSNRRQLVQNIGEAPRGTRPQVGFCVDDRNKCVLRHELVILLLVALFFISVILFLFPNTTVLRFLGGAASDQSTVKDGVRQLRTPCCQQQTRN